MQKEIDKKGIYKQVLEGVPIKVIAKESGIGEHIINDMVLDTIKKESSYKGAYFDKEDKLKAIEKNLWDMYDKKNLTGFVHPQMANYEYIYVHANINNKQ